MSLELLLLECDLPYRACPSPAKTIMLLLLLDLGLLLAHGGMSG